MNATKDYVLYALCLEQLQEIEAEVIERVKQPIYKEEMDAYNRIADALFDILSGAAVRQRVQRKNMKEASEVRQRIGEVLEWNMSHN